ncbi:MAG: putative transporter ATP-binding protein [Acidimicrobiia bacterium]|nr:putative transporter ATP-binding protein [Acidimicrobiia bacterium]
MNQPARGKNSPKKPAAPVASKVKPKAKPEPPANATSPADIASNRAAQAGKPAKPTKAEAAIPTVLRAKGLTKVYGDLVALAPLDIHVAPGEAVVLIGHNGSGKTTFLRMASGLLDVTDGDVFVNGARAGTVEARAGVSYLSDSPTFYDDLSVWEHLELTAGLHGVTDWEQHGADLLDHLGLYDRADDLPSRFSRGLKQKASIAIGLIRPMSLLLVDEPFVGLDAAGKVALLELFDTLHQDGVALMVATHELEFVKRVQRCIALRDGQLIHDGPVDGIDALGLVS